MSRGGRRVRSKEKVTKGDVFAVMLGRERVYSHVSAGACLSYLQGKIDHSSTNASGTVVFEPLIGPGATVYIVTKNGRTTRTQVVNDIA